jgi:7-keto-8-aminopelargonate synthetase-like enzyme
LFVEGVSQRTGRVAPLKELVALKQKYGALLIVDETLSFGTLGSRGLGLSKEFGSHVDAIIGSLEHAAAVVGGFCAGRGDLIEHQRLAGAGYCFSASCPPAACSMASATVMDLIDGDSSERLAKLKSNASLLHEMLRSIELCGKHVQAVSSPESYVQHLWFDSQSDLPGTIAERVAASGFRVQLCSATVCPVEDIFRSKLKAPTLTGVSLRICASAESAAQDIIALATSIREALAAP